jgi:hypothetical protein
VCANSSLPLRFFHYSDNKNAGLVQYSLDAKWLEQDIQLSKSLEESAGFQMVQFKN